MAMPHYEQTRTVLNMHSVPRFGHSSNVALLASPSVEQQDDYKRGVQLFCSFLLMILFLWTVILIIFKIMGPTRVGCAAGGNVLDIPLLRQQYSRGERKEMEQRSWRLQTTFMSFAILLFVLVGLFLNKGLGSMGTSLSYVYDVSDSMERVATRALDITHSMQKEQARLQSAHLEILQIQQSCPTLRHNTTANSSIPWELSSLNTTTLKETIHATLVQVNFLVDTNVQNAQTALVKVKEATQSMDQAINVFKANEWKPKLCMVVLVVVNIFFIVGVILSRNNVAYNPYQCVAAYVLIPTFCTCLLLMALGTYGFGAGAVANADFCAGGQYESYPSGSPVGTIEEIMKQQGVSPNDVVYQSYQYYVNGCKGENPLVFLEEYRPQFKSTMDAVDSFLAMAEQHGIKNLNQACGADMVPVMTAVLLVKDTLQSIQTHLESALDLSSCYKVSPFLRQIVNGPICQETVSSLTWLFSCSFAISIAGFIMLSTRAALYNATLRPERRKMSKRRLKKEFKEYKEFMEQFYDNVHEWKLHPSPEKKKELPRSDSDTDIAALPSNDTEVGSSDAVVENPRFQESESLYSNNASRWTPRARRLARSFAGCIVDSPEPTSTTRNALRDVTNSNELEPLSLDAPIKPPATPTKKIKSFKRTSLGQSCRPPNSKNQSFSSSPAVRRSNKPKPAPIKEN